MSKSEPQDFIYITEEAKKSASDYLAMVKNVRQEYARIVKKSLDEDLVNTERQLKADLARTKKGSDERKKIQEELDEFLARKAITRAHNDAVAERMGAEAWRNSIRARIKDVENMSLIEAKANLDSLKSQMDSEKEKSRQAIKTADINKKNLEEQIDSINKLAEAAGGLSNLDDELQIKYKNFTEQVEIYNAIIEDETKNIDELKKPYEEINKVIVRNTAAEERYLRRSIEGSKYLAEAKAEEAKSREKAVEIAEYELELAEEAVAAAKDKLEKAKNSGDNKAIKEAEKELELNKKILEVRQKDAKEAKDNAKEALQLSIEANKYALEKEKSERDAAKKEGGISIKGRSFAKIQGDPKAQIASAIDDRTKDAKASLEISKQELELQKKQNAENKKAREEAKRQKLADGTWTDEDEKSFEDAEQADKKALADKERKVQTDSEVVEALEKLGDKMEAAFASIDDAMKTYYQYTAKMDARLQGSSRDFEDVVEQINSNLALSPLVKTKEVMEKINEAVEHGIVYNVEQRAFLETISEKIANTFDAFDANLLRLIKLQQADSTAARLGMEATLLKMFNSMFEDNSYLSDSGARDAVAGAIIDAQSQMTRDQALEFEFTVQKWLGSLGSLGMSNESLTKIAEGLNYLGTGDVEALSSNESLQTLMAMSASKAGLSLADMLTGGVTADTTNKLLESMVEYLKEIAEGDNQVVKSAYGGIFSMSQSDMRAISNLTSDDINSIASQNLTYNRAVAETQGQLFLAAARTPISEMMDNIFDNVMTNIGTEIADSPGLMAAWKINDFIEGQTGGINIPFINAMGFGLDLNANVNQLIKLGIAGTNILGMAGNMLSSLANGGGLRLDGWDANEYTSRGTGFVGISEGVTSGTSQSEYIGSASSDDAQKSTLASATEDAKESGEITNAGMDVEHTFDEFYGQLLEEKNPVAILEPDDDDSLKELFRRFVNDLFINDEPVMSELTDNTLKAILGPIGYIGELLKGSLFGDGAVSSYNSTTSSDVSNLSAPTFNNASNNLLADVNNVDIDRTKTLYSVLQNAMSMSGDASSLNVSNADLSSIYTYLTGDVGGTSLSNALSTLATTTNISDLGTSLDTNLSDVSTNINTALGFTESGGNLTSIIGSGNESLNDVLNLIYGETSIKTLSDNVTAGLDTVKTAIAGETGSGVSDVISDFSGKFDSFTQSVVPSDGGLKVDFSSFSFNADNELSVTLPADTLDSLAHIKLLYDELITNDTELYVNLKEESTFNSSLVAIKDEVAAVKALIEPNGKSSKLDDIKNTYDLLKSILGNGVASEEDTLANLMQTLKNKINDASGFKVYATNSSTDVDTALGQVAHVMTLSGNY